MHACWSKPTWRDLSAVATGISIHDTLRSDADFSFIEKTQTGSSQLHLSIGDGVQYETGIMEI